MMRKKRLLGRRESFLDQLPTCSSSAAGLHVFPKVKLSEIMELNDPSACVEGCAGFENMCFDFVLSSAEFDALLAIDFLYCDFGEMSEPVGLREKIASEAELGIVMADCSSLTAEQVAQVMDSLVWDWKENSSQVTDPQGKYEYRSCLLHLSACDSTSCDDFASISHILLDSHFDSKQMVNKVRLATETEPGVDGLFESKIFLLVNESKFEIASGRCRVFGSAMILGPLLSMHIASLIASQTFEDARRHLSAVEEICLIATSSKEETALTHSPLFSISALSQCSLR